MSGGRFHDSLAKALHDQITGAWVVASSKSVDCWTAMHALKEQTGAAGAPVDSVFSYRNAGEGMIDMAGGHVAGDHK